MSLLSGRPWHQAPQMTCDRWPTCSRVLRTPLTLDILRPGPTGSLSPQRRQPDDRLPRFLDHRLEFGVGVVPVLHEVLIRLEGLVVLLEFLVNLSQLAMCQRVNRGRPVTGVLEGSIEPLGIPFTPSRSASRTSARRMAPERLICTWPLWAVVTVCCVLVFVPICYLYPSRTQRFQVVTMALTVLWGASSLALVVQYPDVHPALAIFSLGYVAYYFLMSIILTVAARPR